MTYKVKYATNSLVAPIGRVFLFVSIVLLAISLFIVCLNNKKASSYNETVGTIVSQSQSATKTLIEYKVAGKTYRHSESYYSAFDKIGKEVKIYVNPNDPTDVFMKINIVIYILVPMSVIFGIISFFALRSAISFKKNLKKLMTDGLMVRATVEGFRYNYNYQINNKPSLMAVASNGNNKYISQPFFTKCDVTTMVGTSVNVFIDPENKNNYFVEIP